MRMDEVNELIDGICGVVLTHLSGMAARCAPRGDLATRRSIERVVFEVRTEIANVCQQMADKCGEPPVHELERYMRCRQCSEVQGYPYKRSHLVALRPTKISANDPQSTWWPGER